MTPKTEQDEQKARHVNGSGRRRNGDYFISVRVGRTAGSGISAGATCRRVAHQRTPGDVGVPGLGCDGHGNATGSNRRFCYRTSLRRSATGNGGAHGSDWDRLSDSCGGTC